MKKSKHKKRVKTSNGAFGKSKWIDQIRVKDPNGLGPLMNEALRKFKLRDKGV